MRSSAVSKAEIIEMIVYKSAPFVLWTFGKCSKNYAQIMHFFPASRMEINLAHRIYLVLDTNEFTDTTS